MKVRFESWEYETPQVTDLENVLLAYGDADTREVLAQLVNKLVENGALGLASALFVFGVRLGSVTIVENQS